MTDSVLWIAEKESLIFQALLPALPGQNDEETKFYVRRGNHHFIALNGHAIEQALPDAYLDSSVPTNSSGGKVWRKVDLPIVPTTWQMVEKDNKRHRLSKLQQLLKQCEVVYHVGDPDPAGQRIVDEVLELYGNRKPVKRVLINDYNPTMVKQALSRISDNNDALFQSWSRWELARSRYDWLVGFNATRAMTIRARELGHDVTLPIGSVQTVVQWIVVENDKRIEQFRPVPYFKLTARFTHANGSFTGRWRPGPEQRGLEDGRLIDKAVAEQLVTDISVATALITTYAAAPKKAKPPLTMGLDELQMEAFSRFGYSAKETAAAAQRLYETYQVTTYPRSDNRYLSEAAHSTAATVIARIFEIRPDLQDLRNLLDPTRKSPSFNDLKMVNTKGEPTPHHAIVPTLAEVVVDTSSWTEQERNIYDLIVRTYLAQFTADFEYMQTNVEIEADGQIFAAAGRTTIASGWQRVLAPSPELDAEPDQTEQQALPPMEPGDPLAVEGVDLNDAKTSPPAHFDERRLIDAMKRVHKYVTDTSLAARLREADGIGTTATRSVMLTEMQNRGILIPVKPGSAKLQAAPQTRALIDVLPDDVKSAAQAGLFKLKLDQVASGELSMDQFLDDTIQYVRQIVHVAAAAPFSLAAPTVPIHACPKCQGEMHLGQKVAECKSCQLKLWREIAGKSLSDKDMSALIAGETTREISGFTSSKRTKFSAPLRLDTSTWKITFSFPEKTMQKPEAHPFGAACPNCTQPLQQQASTISCTSDCGFKLWTLIASKQLTPEEVQTLLANGRVGPLKGFVSRAKTGFSATVVIDASTGKTNFEFEPRPGSVSK